MFELKREAAKQYGYADHPYDALLEEYEPGMTVAQIRPLFAELSEGIVPLVRAIAASATANDASCLLQPYDHDKQLAFGLNLVTGLGYDLTRGRQDLTAHPFCTSFGPDDVRITTRVDREFLSPALFGTLHETGHALYEQGIPAALARTPIGHYASLGVHESQSRLWENLVGRSLPFWKRHYSSLQATFPNQLRATSLDTFYRAINVVEPSYIRVEADELTYNLHIFLRFNLEVALLEGTLSADDLPAAWNDGIRDLLGITPPNRRAGRLAGRALGVGTDRLFPDVYARQRPGRTNLGSRTARRPRHWGTKRTWRIHRIAGVAPHTYSSARTRLHTKPTDRACDRWATRCRTLSLLPANEVRRTVRSIGGCHTGRHLVVFGQSD